MKTKILIGVLAIFFITATSYADDVPKIVIDGFNAYKISGVGEAINVWLKGSPMESDKMGIVQLQGGFTQIESAYGKMVSYEILKSIKISPVSNRIYAEILYERGPVFMFFDCYKSLNGWIIPIVRCHTEVDKILPADFLK
jgi:hypothetical protein